MPLFQSESKCENDSHENDPVSGAYFHMKGFALRLVLILGRQKATRKWPIERWRCILT